MTFKPICDAEFIDVHPNPPPFWRNCVVAGGWRDATAVRKDWPHAAAVGPLRTIEGIERFIRNVLANPAIRVVIWDGPDLTPNESTKNAFDCLWTGSPRHVQLAEELKEPFRALQAQIAYYRGDVFRQITRRLGLEVELAHLDVDREGGAVVLPPPPPKPLPDLIPHGDPGDRVVGDTLADVWPLVLRNALRFGRRVPTQYGETKEVLNLVSVIRDPAASLGLNDGGWPYCAERGGAGNAEAEMDPPEVRGPGPHHCDTCKGTGINLTLPHPVLGITWAEVEAYYERITGAEAPEGSDYSYGSRLHGVGEHNKLDLYAGGVCWRCNQDGAALAGTCPHGHVDQYAHLDELLTKNPETRAAYLTPWRPDEDAGKEGGRPCLVGLWFRATGGQHAVPVLDAVGMPSCPRCGFEAGQPVLDGRGCEGNPRMLHLTMQFRSHDLAKGYPTNLAALCKLLVETAHRHDMQVGTLTCLSMSAHVYASDYARADAVVEAMKIPAIAWDPRVSFRVEVVDLGLAAPADGKHVWHDCKKHGHVGNAENCLSCMGGLGGCVVCGQWEAQLEERCPGATKRAIRVSALTPGDMPQVVATWEDTRVEKLCREIAASGLIQSVQNALWLGAEIRAAHNKLRGDA